MAMVTFIFNHNYWDQFYASNCSMKTDEEWLAEGTKDFGIGITYMTIGIIGEILYIPLLIVMSREEFLNHSCYKLMFLLGICDLIVLPFNAIMAGIQCVLGLHFCNNPNLFFIVGCITSSGWFCASTTAIILALNRFFEILMPALAKVLYGGKKIFIWLLIPIFYTGCTLFFIPAVFSNKYHAFFFDLDFQQTPEFKQSVVDYFWFTAAHSMLILSLMLGVYFTLCIFMTMKVLLHKNNQLSKLQRLMFFQSLFICMEMVLVAVFYVYSQLFPIPMFMIIVDHIALILVHGDTPIVYLLLNKSVRRGVIDLFSKLSGSNLNTEEVSPMGPSRNITHHARRVYPVS